MKPKKALSRNDHDYLSTQFADSSQLTPAAAVSNFIGRTVLSEGFGAAVARAVESANIRSIKSQSRTQSTVNNVRELKAKQDLEDDCLIYDIVDGSVVTSSTLRIQFSAKMWQTDSLIFECPLTIDGCEITLNENGTEIKLVMYHSVFHKVVWIAKYGAPGLTELSQAVEYVLKCVSALCYAKHQMPFKPIQTIISDESAGFELGCEKFFGPRRKTEFQSCQFQFAHQKARVARIIDDEADSRLFQDLTAKLISSATTVSFDNTIKALKPLREKYPAVDVFVNSYSHVKHKIVRWFLMSSRQIQSSSLAETSNWS